MDQQYQVPQEPRRKALFQSWLSGKYTEKLTLDLDLKG